MLNAAPVSSPGASVRFISLARDSMYLLAPCMMDAPSSRTYIHMGHSSPVLCAVTTVPWSLPHQRSLQPQAAAGLREVYYRLHLAI